MPLISYIVPCYNVPADMLTACIDSILAIDLRDGEREIIVIDDGSRIPCQDALKDYGHKLTVVRQDNQGLSAARNTGISLAKGEYLHFVDADDTLVAHPYNLCIQKLRESKPDLLAFNFTTSLNEEAKQTAVFQTFRSGAEFMLKNNLHVASCTYIFRRDALGSLRFTPNLKNEDERFSTLLYIDAGKTVVTNAKAYYYRQREGSLQHTADATFVNSRLADYQSTMRLFSSMTFSDANKRKAMRRRVSQMTMDCIYNTIMLTRDQRKLQETITSLRGSGLFPMPLATYTAKYFLFSCLANSSTGRKLLFRLLSLFPKEI